MKIEIRYAQGKGGQRLHIVPVLSGGVLNTALCGRHVDHWRGLGYGQRLGGLK